METGRAARTLLIIAACIVCGIAAGYLAPRMMSGSPGASVAGTAPPAAQAVAVVESPTAATAPAAPAPRMTAPAAPATAPAPRMTAPAAPVTAPAPRVTAPAQESLDVPGVAKDRSAEVIEWGSPTPAPRKSDDDDEVMSPEEEAALMKEAGIEDGDASALLRRRAASLPAELQAHDGLLVSVNKRTHKMTLLRKGEVIDQFKITVGKEDRENLTPSGVYRVTGVTRNPTWHVPGRVQKAEKLPAVVKPYSSFKGKTKKDGNLNGLGVLWIGLRWVKNWSRKDPGAAEDGLGIHGTNEPDRIGGSWGHGCVRMRNSDILKLEKHMAGFDRAKIKVVIRSR